MALLPDPTPPQVRALASVLSNRIRDAPPPPPHLLTPGGGSWARTGRTPSASTVAGGTDALQWVSLRAAPRAAPRRRSISLLQGTNVATGARRLATLPCPAYSPLVPSASPPQSSMPSSASSTPGCR